jgi:hypothetical protein
MNLKTRIERAGAIAEARVRAATVKKRGITRMTCTRAKRLSIVPGAFWSTS